jgi:flagellar hook-associated protein 3 FlgL
MISGSRFRLNVEIARQTRLAQEIARGQVEIATGKKILAPSDDPIGSARTADITRSQGDEATWLRNVNTASALAARSDTVLTSVATGVDRAKELMVKAATGTNSPSDRAIIATELRELAKEIAALRETRDPRGEPLFRTNGELEVPVSAGIRLSPVPTRGAIFDAPLDIVSVINAAAAAAVEPDTATRTAASQAALTALDGAVAQVATARADQGIRADRLDKIKDRLEDSKIQLLEQKAGIEGADIPEVIARIQNKIVNLQAAQSIFARVNKQSLFDLI